MNIFKSIILENVEHFVWSFGNMIFLFLFKLRAGMVLKWIPNGPTIIQWSTPPIPIPSVSKSLLPGGKQINKKHIFGGYL